LQSKVKSNCFSKKRSKGDYTENGNLVIDVMKVEEITHITANVSKQKACHFRWSNIIKIVDTKEKSNGLIKSSISDDKRGDNDGNIGNSRATAESRHKVIINQVSGEAKPSEVLAIMGPSGSGKTSLLNILATRSTYEAGTVSLNDKVLTNNPSRVKLLKRKIAYIKQNDIFFNHLTVKDQLTYTAFLRLGDEVSKADKRFEVDRIIKLLRLEKCADTPIRLISGGERKRTNIGTELLTQPSLIFLDEPTSGLDSSSAVALMSLLRTLAHQHGKTIITSIHQPSSAVFHKFDRVLFLADGCAVYNGLPSESLSYIKDIGYTCPDGYNAADHWMDLLVDDSATSVDQLYENSTQENIIENGEMSDQKEVDMYSLLKKGNDGNGGNHHITTSSKPDRSTPSISTSIISTIRRSRKGSTLQPSSLATQKRSGYMNKSTPRARLITLWDVSRASLEIEQDLENDITAETCDSSVGTNLTNAEKGEKKFNTSWLTQFQVLLHRSMKNSRAAILTPLNAVKAILLGVMVGFLWFQMEYTEKVVQDRAGYMFFSITFWIFDGTFSALFSFPTERAIIFKERASGSYHLSAYFMAKTISDLPTRLVLPLIYMIISYWMAAANQSFAVFLLTCMCTLTGVLSGESLGLLVAALVMDFEKGMTVLIVFSLTCLVSGGYYVQNVPTFMQWTPYLSPFKYAYHSTTTLIFDHPVPCDGSGILEVICNKDGITFATPEEVREILSIQGSVVFNVGMMMIMIFVARYLAFLALKNKRGGDRE